MMLKTDFFKIRHNGLLPSPGRLLISEPFLSELCFQRSIILMIESEDGGGMGIVTNKRTKIFLNEFIDGLSEIEQIPVFCGGPVNQDRLFYLHNLGELIPGAKKIGEDLYIDGDFETLLSYIRAGYPLKGHIRFFLGYAGWEKDQLYKEINDDSWLVTDNQNLSILRMNGDEAWKEAICSLEPKYHQWINYPRNPMMN